METIQHIISQFGYPGIFALLMLGIFGLPVPDETLLAFCGYLVLKGELHPVYTVLAAFLGSCSGVSVSYVIGRSAGPRLIRKFGKHVHLTEERVEQVHKWFNKAGKWILTIGYFIPGFRHATAIVAGTSRLQYPAFALFAYLGAFIWSITFVALGYFVGEKWHHMSHRMHRILLIILAGAVLVAVVWLGVRWLRKRAASKHGAGPSEASAGIHE